MELLLAFLIGVISSLIFMNIDHSFITNNMCPMKDVIVDYAKKCGSGTKIKRELKEYSLQRIQLGHLEYTEVIETLMKKEQL